MWRRLSQWPTSCVAVLPRLKGGLAVPEVPKAVFRITTPSVFLGPPGNCAYPRMPFARAHTQIFRYLSVGQAFTPPVAANFTESSVSKDVRVVFVRVIPVVGLPFGSFDARAN